MTWPVDASVPAEIAQCQVDLSDSVVTAAEEAGRELSRFDAELGHRVASFGPVLLRSDAAASSQIERLTASARGLADNITAEAFAKTHKVLMFGQVQHTPGQWRTEPVWIGTSSRGPQNSRPLESPLTSGPIRPRSPSTARKSALASIPRPPRRRPVRALM